ncbi:ABC transporter ATP-binding protein [Oceanibacterium hippocampi]|uniref:sn-glycerol-3-phosphate import ATP-binding protein UgpC n=1 Tax=Oceanibacterium hippocampi TaxID=745714 RepID=A0A1Y5RX81_9PROT|nr:ABC transporter ATP-binding protein [Oceanibacterium hippocampi]SLN27423.1 sn-glycerol-3-phosphate import ATP-binding protein UgpC [Oceanibacterium hippocampi]
MTISLSDVSLVVGAETWLSDISLDLGPGAPHVLLGPTTAGKTSLIRILAGLDRPSTGRILANGADVTGKSVRKRNVAIVYQQFINYPSFTVYENIAAPLRRGGLPRKEIDSRIREVAALLHIDALLDRLPAELSGGQQQRTALARALVKDADLLLLDEPLVNLDYKLREELRAELREIFARRPSIVVYATTEPTEALLIGGRTVIMDAGRILQSGATAEVYKRPATVRVGEVFSDPPMNMIAGRVAAGRARLGSSLELPLGRHLAALADGPYIFGARCGHLFIDRRADDDLAIPGVLELAEINGSETFIHARHEETSWVAQEEGVHGLALGQPVTLYINPRHLYAFDDAGRLAAAPSGG